MILGFSVLMTLYYHKQAWYTDPGSPEDARIVTSKEQDMDLSQVTPAFKKLLEHSQSQYRDLSRLNSVQICLKCDHKPIKPERAHHCRSCKRDVLLMDHHCRKYTEIIYYSLDQQLCRPV